MAAVGHFTWAVLIRRSILSIFDAVYSFISIAGPRRRRLWGRVEEELRLAAIMVMLSFADSQLQINHTVIATDASGSSAAGSGGFGVTQRECAPRLVEDALACSEKWRYGVLDEIQARATALGLQAVARVDAACAQARRGAA